MSDNKGLYGISQRIPPSNLQAEQALLGALLANNKAYEKVVEFLKPHHFADPVHGRIYQAIVHRIENGSIADAITLKSDLENSGILDDVGGTQYLAQLLASMVGILNAGEYGQAIHDAWLRRQLITIGETAVNLAFGVDPEVNVRNVVAGAISELMELADELPTDSIDFAMAASEVVRKAEAAYKGEAGTGGLHTGIPSVDKLWSGMWPGRLYYLMARSRSGKTPFMAQICRSIARRFQREADENTRASDCVHIFSLEMSAEDFQAVNIAGESKWTGDQIKSGQIGSDSDWFEFDQKAIQIGKLPIIVDDGKYDMAELAMRARVVHRQKRSRLIAIDYLELIKRSEKQWRMGPSDWVVHLGYELKSLAKELGVPILALRQINKARDKADSTRPAIGDLPYDGGQAADEIFALYRRELDMPPEPPGINFVRKAEDRAQKLWEWEEQKRVAAGQAEFIALKRRFGPTGTAHLRFVGSRMLFAEMELGQAQKEEHDFFNRGEA